MTSALRVTVHCCVILATLFHGIFGESNSKDQEIRRAVISKRIEEIVKGKDSLKTFINYAKNQTAILQKPEWSDFYLEMEVPELLQKVGIKKQEHLEIAKQIDLVVRDKELLHTPLNSKALKKFNNAAKEVNTLHDEMSKIRGQLLNMYEDVQRRKGESPELMVCEIRRRLEGLAIDLTQMIRDDSPVLSNKEFSQTMGRANKDLEKIFQNIGATIDVLQEEEAVFLKDEASSSTSSKSKPKGKGKGKSQGKGKGKSNN